MLARRPPWKEEAHVQSISGCFVVYIKGFVKFKYEGGKFHVTNDSQGLSAPPLHCCSGETLVLKRCGNDPSAGSPTETLLRLHLPLNDEV